jgi:uncharacterized iron-regulated membrane protein
VARRLWFVWHSWIGLTAGLMLFVVCWSGTWAVIAHELDRLANPAVQGTPVATPAWDAAYRAARAARPDLEDWSIEAAEGPGAALEILGTDEAGDYQRLYADPASGRILGATTFFNVQRFFRSFHRNLFLVGIADFWGLGLGDLIVTFFSLVLIAQLVTTLVFYKRWWRRFLALEWRRGTKVFWSGVHKLTGLWSLWFVLLMGLTGLWYMIEFTLPDPPAAGGKPAISAAELAAPPNLARAISTAESAYPGFRVTVISVGASALELSGYDGSLLVRDRAATVLTPYDGGRVLEVHRTADLSAYDRWVHTADPLHFGNFGGLWSKAIWFVFGIFLSSLSLTGAYLHAKRQARRQGTTRLRTPIFLAYAATVAILALSVRYGLLEIADYAAEGAWPETPMAVWAIIATWIASTVAALTVWMKAVR